MKKLYFLIVIFFLHSEINAQLSVNAGPDTVFCVSGSVQIGGNPSATGGTAPYSYLWTAIGQFASLFLDSVDIANPDVINAGFADSVDFVLTVTDANAVSASDTVKVFFSNWICILVDCIHFKSAGDTVTLFTTCTSNFQPMQVVWTPGNFLSNDTSFSPQCWTTFTQTYTAAVRDGKGCVMPQVCNVNVLTTSVQEKNTELVISYPNPIESISTLIVPEKYFGSNLIIYTNDGRKLAMKLINEKQTLISPLLNEQHGIFCYRLVKDGQQITSGIWTK